ncbi:hypothetical protein II582_01925 [bacterium]|nr:hypothetical protein [bacterium]
MVTSKKFSLIFLAANCKIFISDTLKNVTNKTKIRIIIAKTAHAALLQAFCHALNATTDSHTHIATNKSWITEILNGQIFSVKPDKNHFLIFFGNVTFIKTIYIIKWII